MMQRVRNATLAELEASMLKNEFTFKPEFRQFLEREWGGDRGTIPNIERLLLDPNLTSPWENRARTVVFANWWKRAATRLSRDEECSVVRLDNISDLDGLRICYSTINNVMTNGTLLLSDLAAMIADARQRPTIPKDPKSDAEIGLFVNDIWLNHERVARVFRGGPMPALLVRQDKVEIFDGTHRLTHLKVALLRGGVEFAPFDAYLGVPLEPVPQKSPVIE
ncbi:MAG: hypothetical protein ACHQX1_01335, partial [Candidatus Micrarchaeales archaeon]